MMATAEPTPLESFLREYADVMGGAWDEVEPQVYDLLLPESAARDLCVGGDGILRVTFDPEALPEHPGSQLASFGTPLIDSLLKSAIDAGRHGRLYFSGLNLLQHNVESRMRRPVQLPEKTSLAIGRVRPLHFAQAIFWFEAEFVSDQKEQEMIAAGIDLFSRRPVRRLDRLLVDERLEVQPAAWLPDAPRASLADGCLLARQQAIPTLAAMANTRVRELQERLDRQVARMQRYYADLREESASLRARAEARQEDTGKYDARRQALHREEQLRIGELRQKSTLRMHVRVLDLLVIQQPKLTAPAAITLPSGSRIDTRLVWDPLTESLEAPDCPACGRPSFAFLLTRLGHLACPNCPPEPAGRSKR